MNTSPLIQAGELATRLRDAASDVVVFDCSFDLADTAAGRRAHEAGHVPGARYLHLDDDLSAARNGRNGRHPLPAREDFAARLAALGVNGGSLVVVYDRSGGMYAARAWWMLHWVGHAQVAVLDGGLAAWKAAGGALQTGVAAPAVPGTLRLGAAATPTVTRDDLLAHLSDGTWQVVDARAPDRFRGENETLDPVGGHIPGAVNRLFRDNLGADGRFKPADVLRAEWRAVPGSDHPERWVMSCGSGVTACHNLLALEVAGLGGARLYPGSWSEWCSWPHAPVGTGAS